MSLIELQDLQFQYPSQAWKTLDIPSLKIEKKDKVFLFGPSGSGKTTLLEILAGVLVPQSGSLKLIGEEIQKLSPAARDQFRAGHLGYIFQSFNLIPYLTVNENIQLPLSFSPLRRQRLQERKASEEVQSLCDRLGILDLKDRPVNELSVGQQQRVAVARALLGSPEIILADEPTSALDQDHREKFIRLLFEVCESRETTVIFVSHDRSLMSLFDRSLSLLEINQARGKA